MANTTPAGVDWETRSREARLDDLLNFLAESSHPDDPLPGTGSRHAVWWAIQAIDPREGRLVMPVDFHYYEHHPDGYVVSRWRGMSNRTLREATDRGLIEVGGLEPVGDWFDTLHPPTDDEDPNFDQVRWFHHEAIEKGQRHDAGGCGAPRHECRIAYRERGRRLQITDRGFARVANRVLLEGSYQGALVS